MNNPYIAPESDLLLPKDLDSNAGLPLQYAGFWPRLGAYFIDMLIMLPWVGLSLFLGTKSRLFFAYVFVPGQLVSLWYYGYLVSKYGGTPGKILMKLKITLFDGTPITLKKAVIRYIAFMLVMTIASVALNLSALNMSDAEFHSLSYMERSKRIMELAPAWYQPALILAQICFWIDLITMLFNRKRRTIHDFIAGTVVVRHKR